MSNVVKFRRSRRIPLHRQKPRQRVFYLGHRYIGGACYESIQHVYLKRHKHDQWGLIDYSEGYACEFDWCGGSELMDLLTQLNLEDPPSERDLYNMGWRGPMEGEIYEFHDYYVGC